MNNIYHRQVALLIKIMPSVFRIKDFAVHIVHKPDVWKLQNINKLRNTNTKKFEESISKLTDYFGLKMY